MFIIEKKGFKMKKVFWNLLLVGGVAVSSLYAEWGMPSTSKITATAIEIGTEGAGTMLGTKGSFNVVSETAPINYAGDTDPIDENDPINALYTQETGTFKIKIVHLDDDNETLSNYMNWMTVRVDLIPNSGDCKSVPALKTYSFLTIPAGASKVISFTYKGVERDVTFRIRYGMPTQKIACARDNFAIKPKFNIPPHQPIKKNHNIDLNITVVDGNGDVYTGYSRISDDLNFEVETTIGERVYPLMYDFRIVDGVIDEKYIRYPEANKLKFTLSEIANGEEFAKVDIDDTPDEQRLIRGVSPEIEIYTTSSHYYAGKGTGESENSPSKMTYTSEIKSKTDRVYHKLGW
jgi:hypothetical protein